MSDEVIFVVTVVLSRETILVDFYEDVYKVRPHNDNTYYWKAVDGQFYYKWKSDSLFEHSWHNATSNDPNDPLLTPFWEQYMSYLAEKAIWEEIE